MLASSKVVRLANKIRSIAHAVPVIIINECNVIKGSCPGARRRDLQQFNIMYIMLLKLQPFANSIQCDFLCVGCGTMAITEVLNRQLC